MHCLAIATEISVFTHWSHSYFTGLPCWSQLWAVCLLRQRVIHIRKALLHTLEKDTFDDVYSEDITSNLQRCLNDCGKPQFTPKRHCCGLYLHSCVTPYIMKYCELRSWITRQMKTVKNKQTTKRTTFRTLIVNTHSAHRNAWDCYTQDNLILSSNPVLKEYVMTQIIYPQFLHCVMHLVKYCQLRICLTSIFKCVSETKQTSLVNSC